MAKSNSGSRRAASRRSAARLGAVQALYQMDMAGTKADSVIEEFTVHRLGKELDGNRLDDADVAFFQDLVKGVVNSQRELDPRIDEQLATGWRLARVDSILRAILRAGTYELARREDVPSNVVITEYIDIAHAFFETDEPKVVNAVLDNLAGKIRGAAHAASEDG